MKLVKTLKIAIFCKLLYQNSCDQKALIIYSNLKDLLF